MRMKPFPLAALAAGLSLSAAEAAGRQAPRTAPEVVVSASRIPLPPEEIGSAASAIGRRELETGRVRFVADALRRIPGVAVGRQGPPGGFTQIRIRGAEANHTLLRIDGIEVGDPATGEADFAHLLAPDVDRVTVLRGPQSALWGSHALAGAIDVRTRRGAGPAAVEGFAEGGAFARAAAGFRFGAGDDRRDYALSVTGLRSDGVNAARAGGERDGYRNLSASFVGGLRAGEALELDAALRLTRFGSEYDTADFASGLLVDADRETRGQDVQGRIGAAFPLFDGLVEQKFEAAFADAERENSADRARASQSAGERLTLGAQSHLAFGTGGAGAEHALTAAFERERTRAEAAGFTAFERSVVEDALIGEYRLGLLDRVFLSGAVRHDDNDLFADATTWRTTAAVLLPDPGLRLHASWGTGVTDPSFWEMFGSDPDFQGNPALRPERSRGWDFGVEAPLFDGRGSFDATWFQATLEDEIVQSFVQRGGRFVGTLGNAAGKSARRGIEVSAEGRPLPNLSVRGSYTWTQSEDGAGVREIRRPRHLASLGGAYEFLDGRGVLDLGVDWNGGQTDTRFSSAGAETVKLAPYALVRIAGSWRLSDRLELFGRVENALDQDYEEVFSYRSPGIGIWLGLRVTGGGG